MENLFAQNLIVERLLRKLDCYHMHDQCFVSSGPAVRYVRTDHYQIRSLKLFDVVPHDALSPAVDD